MEDKILAKVKKQLAKDYNCSVKDFENKDNIITEAKVIRGKKIPRYIQKGSFIQKGTKIILEASKKTMP